MSRFTTDVRRMLERRANDIGTGEPASVVPLATTEPESRRWVFAVAAAVIVTAGLTAVFINAVRAPESTEASDSSDGDGETPAATGPSTSLAGEPDPAQPAGDTFEDGAMTPLAGDWQDLLPPDFDPLRAAPIPDTSGGDALDAAERYLASRLPDLQVELELVERDGLLHVFEWLPVFDHDEGDYRGTLIVREHNSVVHGVVAAVNNTIDASAVARDAARLTGTIRDGGLDSLYADVLDLAGLPVDGSPDPDGITDGELPIFGTAGQSDEMELALDVELGDEPVVLRLQHVGGTWLSVTEFVFVPDAFAAPCGTNPPAEIDVSEVGELVAVPLDGSWWPAMGNQGRWHVTNGAASLEILWPASPALWLETFEGEPANQLISYQSDSSPGILDVVLMQGADACDRIQLSLSGDTFTIEQWASALSGQWAFGEPLSVSGLEQLDERYEPITAELEVSALPVVPATGSCDGLPDAPPITGWGSDYHETPEELLLALVAEPKGEWYWPDEGYTKLTSADGAVIGFALDPDNPIIVVEVAEEADGWRAVAWTTAAC